MEELREGHDSQFSNLVTGSCTEVEKGGGRKRWGKYQDLCFKDV